MPEGADELDPNEELGEDYDVEHTHQWSDPRWPMGAVGAYHRCGVAGCGAVLSEGNVVIPAAPFNDEEDEG